MDGLDEVLESLGVPKRVYQGSPQTSSSLAYLQALEECDTKRHSPPAWCEEYRAVIGSIVLPAIEKAFPVLFWEPVFLCSPRGRMLRRRAKRVKIV